MIMSAMASHSLYESHDQQLRVGDRVVLKQAGNDGRATVIEDRGPLGIDGRQIVGIRLDGETAREFEVRAEDLALLDAA